jgi:hypothetical protein
MPKLPTNLSVDHTVMERGKLYGQRHGTSVSQLVGDFLANLPLSEEIPEFSPTAGLLYGVAARLRARQVEDATPEEAAAAYHRHLVEKYGSTK